MICSIAAAHHKKYKPVLLDVIINYFVYFSYKALCKFYIIFVAPVDNYYLNH